MGATLRRGRRILPIGPGSRLPGPLRCWDDRGTTTRGRHKLVSELDPERGFKLKVAEVDQPRSMGSPGPLIFRSLPDFQGSFDQFAAALKTDSEG